MKNKQHEVDHILIKIRSAFSDLITQKEHIEKRFFDLNLRIEELQKDLNVSRLIQQRDAELRKEAVDNFGRMKILFPRCEEYLDHIKLKDNETGKYGLERIKFLSKKLKKPMPSAIEAPLLQDLD